MMTIPLTQGMCATVDDEDYCVISECRWCVTKSGRSAYATRYTGPGQKPTTKAMHRVVMELVLGRQLNSSDHIDHVDGDGLNNTRINLRLANWHDNSRNARKQNGVTSIYKGVCRRFGKWEANIAVDRHQVHLGMFGSEEVAARAYDAAARHYFGEFARLNFPAEKVQDLWVPPLRKKAGTTSRYRGVSWNKRRRKWVARAEKGGKVTDRFFDDETEAARAYDVLVTLQDGNDRRVNDCRLYGAVT